LPESQQWSDARYVTFLPGFLFIQYKTHLYIEHMTLIQFHYNMPSFTSLHQKRLQRKRDQKTPEKIWRKICGYYGQQISNTIRGRWKWCHKTELNERSGMWPTSYKV